MKFNPEALDQSFVDWAAVESDPTFQEADNGKKMQMFDAWADYSVAYTDKRKKEAPETDIPKFESAYQRQAEWIKSTRPELAKQYTIQGMLSEEEDTNTLLETLKDIEGLKAKGFSDTDIQAARKQAEDFLMPQMEAFHNNLDGLAGPGPGYTKDQLRQKIWEEPNLGDHLRNIENGLANGFTSVLLGAGQGLATVGAMTGIPGAKEAADWTRGYKEMFAEQLPLDPRMNWATNAAVSGVTQAPAQLATAFATPVQITANFGQMFAEDSDRFFEAEKKDEFERRKAAGILPDETPYSAFEKSLSVKDTEQMRAMANWKAIPSSLINTVGETVSEKLALKGIPWSKIPYGKTIQKQIDNLRKASPKMAVGARMFSNTAGASVAESLTEGGQGITSGLSEAAFYETTDAKDAFKGIGENMVGGAAGGATMSIAPSATRAFREQALFEDANAVVDGTAKSIVGLKAQRDAAAEQYGDDSVQAKTLQRAIDTQENEAHYHLSLVGGVFDETRAKLGQTSADAKNSFRTQLAKYIKDNQVGDFTPEKDIAREQQGALTRLRDNVTRLRNGFRQNGDSTGGTLEAGLDQYEQREAARIQQEADDKRSKADKALSDFVGSVDEDGPGRAAYARVVVGQMFPNFAFTEEFQDDAVVVETLNAVEQNLITDETDLTEWLKAPATKAASETKAPATAAQPQGMMTTGQRLDAFRMAEDNLESADDTTKKEFGRLKEDIQFWNGVINDKEASEQDKAEAAQRLPDLENALLEIATGGVSSQSTNQNDQDQAANQTTEPTQEVPATGAASEGAGTGGPSIRVKTMEGEEVDQTKEDYSAESRGIVRALESGEMSNDAALQNVEAVRQEIEAAPELTPEQKAEWFAPFQNIPAIIEQRQQTTPAASSAPNAESILATPESTGEPELIAGEGTLSQQPTPARMAGVSGDVVRTEAGETVFRNATDATETVLRVKESSIDKDPAALTVEDFESGDGTPLVSEANKEFSVLPENDRPVRPFFRSEAQTQSPDGQTVKSTGSYPVDGGSTPSPATPAPDIAAITADVQANPDLHRMKDGNRKLVSREAAVTVLSQLPETLTNKDVATLAKNSGMTSANFRKLAALRGDQNAVGSLLNGDMDAELGLFDDTILNIRRERSASKAPLNDTTPATKVSNDTNTESTVVGQSPVDRWVNDSFTALEQAAAELPQSSINAALFREKLATDEGRAGIREKLGQMFNTVSRNLKISDPVVREEAMEKIFRGALQKQTGEGLTSNVLQDLLANLQKTGDPFLVKSKGGEVGYSAWLKHRNKQNEFMQAQGKRDMTETLVENEGAPTSASQGVQEEEGEGAGPAFTEGDPDIEAGRSEAKSMQREAIQRAYDKVSHFLAGQYGLDRDAVKAAVARHFSEERGVTLDYKGLGWVVPSKPKVDKAAAALEAAMPDIEQRLVSELKKAIRSAAAEANRLGLLKSDAVDFTETPTLDQIIELGVIDEIQNPDFYNALNEARENKSPEALMPLLANTSENDMASLQTIMGIVLNNGKQITDKKQLTNLNKADMQAVLDSDLLPARLRQTLQTLVDLSGEDGLGLVRNSKNEGFRRLAELYTEQAGNRAPVEVVFNLGLNPSVTGQGLWSAGSNRVHISPFLTREKGLMEATILHEVMHPIWDGKITNYLAGNTASLNDKELAAITELERLFSFSKAEAQKRLDAITDPNERRIMERNLLGTTNLREFLNEALNHRPFQDFLNELTDPNADGKTSVFRTILNKILELIRGGKVSLDSVLQRAFELSTDIASSNKPISMEQRTPSQAEYIRDQEIQKGRPLTEEEVSLAAVNYAMQNPRPRFAESREQADQFAAEYLSDEELDAYNFDRQRDGQPVLSSDMVVSDQQVYEAIKANGGITIDVWTAGQPGTGIVVAPFKETETKIPLNEFKPDDVRVFLRKFRPLLEVSGMHLGGWISDDTVYLDVSIVTDDEVTATALAEDGNQLAVYNIGTGEFPSTPELVARNSGALAQRRSDPDFQNLARSLQQAIRRTLGGLRGEGNPDVPREGTLPEFGIIESLTGQPVTGNELGALQESAERVDAGPVPTRAEVRPSRPNAEPNPFVKDGIRGYNSRYGIAPAIEGHYAPVNEQRARDIAAAYEALPVFDQGRETQEAYAKLAEEIQQQWEYAINEMGVTFEEWSQPGQPYASSREMVRDVRDNKHLWFFTGGEPHPLLNQPDQDGLTMNDKLRAIHDLFGHAAEDYQFGARGEENAWIKHSQMFSSSAQRALTTETRGQNSWVNFGPQNYNEDGTKRSIPAAERPFATQKVALLPEQFMDWQSALKEEPLESKAVFPAPDEKFAGYSQVVDYIEKEYGPKAKALKSWINDSVVAYTASYVSNGNHGQHYIQYNPLRLLHYTRGQVDAVMREEMIHAASGFVLMKKGIGYSEFYEDLAKSLSSAQRSKLKAVYRSTNGMRSVGAEYFRAAIQKLLYGTITETEMQETPMKKIVALLKDFVSYFRRKLVDPVVRDVYEDTVRILQKIDKKNANQDPELGVLSSVSVSYKEAVDRSLRNVIGKAVAEPAQAAFLKPEEFNKAAQSLEVLVNDPVAGKVKARGGRAVNLNSPDDSTARKLEKATGERWDRRLLDARVIHALTESDRTTPSDNKIASAPMVPQTLRQADFVARTDFEGRPFLVFAKLYTDPDSPTGARWHFVEAREDTGAFETQYSDTDPQRGRAMAAKVIGIGDATPKKKKTPTEAGYAQGPSGVSSSNPQGIGPDVSSNQGEVLDNTNVESVQNKILEEIESLTDKQNRLAQSGDYKGAEAVGNQINELTAQFDGLKSEAVEEPARIRSGNPAAVEYVKRYGMNAPKGQTRSLIEVGGIPLFAELVTNDKSNQRSLERAINAMLQNTTKSGRVRMGRLRFEELLSQVWKDANRGTKRDPGWVNFQDARGVNRLAEILAYEAADALSKDGSGEDWYRSKIEGMYSTLSRIYPELAQDGRDRLYFSVLLATTSNGQKVYDNLLDALEIYDGWVASGRPDALPNSFVPRRAERLSAMRSGVDGFNALVQTMGGWEAARQFMLSESTVGDLSKSYRIDISGEHSDQKLLGAMMLGPKIGSFFANLNGVYNTITMDLWFTRTMNRIAGDLIHIEGAKLAEKVGELVANHAAEIPADALEQARELERALSKKEAWATLPMEIRTETDAFYNFVKGTLADYARANAEGKTYANPTPLSKLAQKIVKIIDGGEDSPDNGAHRKWMRRVIEATQAKLREAGIQVENADLQAILWFHEKDLYTQYGATSTGGERTDYDEAARSIVEGSGGTSGGLADFIQRLDAENAGRVRLEKQAKLSQRQQDLEIGQGQLFSAPVPFQGNVVAGFNPSVYTPASARNTEALKRVLSDPDYRSVQAVLSDKRYFAWTEKETLAKANEFIDALKGDLQDAYNKSGTAYGITPEQTILIRGLALKKAQSAANVARAELANPNTPAARRVNLQFIAQHYSDMAENFAEDLMETASLAGQELRSFRLLADALSPQSWVKTYKRAATRSQRKAVEKDEVLRDMMARIKEARRIAASSTTVRMQKALDFAAKRFLPEGASDEEIKAHTDFARVMANQLPVRDAVVQAAVERTVIDGLETIRRSVAPEEQVPESFLRDWENRLRSIASEQINAIIEERLTGGQVDAEAAPELSEQEKEAMREQKITDAWRQFSDFPISETVFSLAKATLVASDSPYANLVRRAQFDPTRIKKLREAVKLSIDTSNEIQLSVGERRMTVESLKLRLSEANPNLNEAQLAKLAEAVEAVYNEEVGRATRLALDGIIRKHAEKQTAKKIAKDNGFTSRLLPLVNMGAFSDEAAYNAIAERLRLPAWNPDTASDIEAKARALQELPEDSIQRQEASVQLMSDILKANIKEARGMQNFGPLMQISSALWSAGILSAPPTQIVNATMTTASVFLESLMEATGYWAAATRNGVSQQQARAYFGDMARAWLFAFGKDANNTSLRAVNEAFGALTKGQTKFRSEKLENMSPLEMFKFDPRVAIPGNKMMEAIISGEGKAAIKEAAKMAVGVPALMAQRVWTRDAKGAVKDYMATMKLVGRFMLAADAMNSFGASATKEMMVRRHLAQQEGMSPQEIEKVMREARQGGNEAVRDAAIAQVENEAQRGDFGPAGSKSHEIAKARRMEQLIETQTYGAETVNAGRDFAAVATFNSDPYGVVGWLMDTLFAGPTKVLGIVTKPINPFPKTMSNLINAAINYTPYGSLRAEGWNLGTAIAKSDRYPQQFLREAPERGTPEYYSLHARAVAGTAAMGLLYMAIMSAVKDREEGKEPWFEVHGPGPSDPKARKQFRDSGAKPFSLRIGKLVVNYTDWPGLNLALGAFGTLYDQMVYSDVEMEISEWAMQTIRAVALTTLNRAALGGASALFEVLSTSVSDDVAESRLKQLASSYATGFTRPSFVRWAETIATGQRQETRTDAGWLLSMAPVVSVFRGRPALNLLGEPIETSKWDATAGRVVTTQGTHPVLTPLTNAQLWVNPPESYKIYDPSKPAMVRDITEAEFYDYSKAYGETLQSILTPKQAEYLAEMSKTAPNTAQETLNGFTRMAADIAKAKLAGRGLAKGKEVKGP